MDHQATMPSRAAGTMLLCLLLLIFSSSASSLRDRVVATAASSSQRSVVAAPSSSSSAWTTRRRRVAFAVVPRGGGSATIDDDGSFSDSMKIKGDEIIECGDEVAAAGEEPSPTNDPELPGPSRFSLSSFLPRRSPLKLSAMMQIASMLVRVTRRTCMAGARAVANRNENESDNCPEVHTILGRTAHVLGEMYRAASTPEEGEEIDAIGGSESRKNKGRHNKRRRRRKKRQRHTTAPIEIVCNGGGMEPSSYSPSTNHAILQLAKRYDIELPTDEKMQLSKRYTDAILPSSQTSLNDALQRANGDARFLMCYISKQSMNGNKIALPNLLSREAMKMANRRPLGKKQSSNSGSHYLWLVDDDKDYESALKRLKVKPPSSSSKKGSKTKNSKTSAAPILVIVYPASTVDPSTGRLKVTPRVLAQHHCRPPPSTPDTLVAWANTIRKRHLREYAKLQHDQKELELLKERTRGYVSSLKEDKVREEKEEQDRRQKEEEEERERRRLQDIQERREGLLEELADEPEAGAEGVITIALRFASGNKRDQRRFVAGETTTNDVFDWIDAVHGVEREKIELSTMNGSRRFRYVDDESMGEEEDGGETVQNTTLENAGLGKMTALRVSEIVIAKEEEHGEEGESEDDEEEDSEEEDE